LRNISHKEEKLDAMFDEKHRHITAETKTGETKIN
jgi:hypothetical protein